MTREEAQKELDALKPKERIAWQACEAKCSERQAFEAMWQKEYDKLQTQWSPLFARKVQLKTFLEIA